MWFEISMNNAPRVTEMHAVHELIHEASCFFPGDAVFVLLQEGFQVMLGKFKNEVKFFLVGNVDNILETG